MIGTPKTTLYLQLRKKYSIEKVMKQVPKKYEILNLIHKCPRTVNFENLAIALLLWFKRLWSSQSA